MFSKFKLSPIIFEYVLYKTELIKFKYICKNFQFDIENDFNIVKNRSINKFIFLRFE